MSNIIDERFHRFSISNFDSKQHDIRHSITHWRLGKILYISQVEFGLLIWYVIGDIHKAELQAFLEEHSPDVVTLNETFTKKGYKYNMPHYTAVTRNRGHMKGGGLAILLRQELTFTEIDDIQLIKTTDNEQLTVAIRTDSNRELYVSTVYCPRGHHSIQLSDGLCENRDQVILTGDFNCKHPELGNDQTNSSGTRLTTVTQNNNLTLINYGTPTYRNASGKEDGNDLVLISQPTVRSLYHKWVFVI